MLEITYRAPYAFANACYVASTLDEAIGLWHADHDANGYCIMNREVKRAVWNGKKVLV